VPGLGASLGRGAATNYQQDLPNSDCILFMGSNMAEAQPVGFRWPMKAKERGATLIHVDPHFSRTSAHCDLYVPIRAGTDIAFLGGVINYILTHDRWFQEYVLHYTNASTPIQEGFQDTEDLDGLFSGFDPETGVYDVVSGRWGYEGSHSDHDGPDASAEERPAGPAAPSGTGRSTRRESTAMPATAGPARVPPRDRE
jgi:formate dehydrogenase major subunit